MSDLPLVQWSFLQFKKLEVKGGDQLMPTKCFLHSATQIGSKILIYGGCDYYGEAQNQLFIYDTLNFQWSSPGDESQFQEDHPGKRYGHSAVLIEMHPPKIMVYGGMIDSGTYEFDSSDVGGVEENNDHNGAGIERSFMSWRKKGKKANLIEESDEAVYFLSLNADNWVWKKPLLSGTRALRPPSRAEHSACKTSTNEVSIFGGWSDKPLNDLWILNYVDMEWTEAVTSGISPKPRYRHTAEMIGTKMYILGGSDNGDDVAENSKYLALHVLSTDTMQWTHPEIKGTSPFPRSGHSSSIIGAHSVAIFGGKRNAEVFLNDFTLIDLETYTSTVVNAVSTHLPTSVGNSTLTSVGNKCFVFGGTNNKGECYNDLRLLDISYYLDKDDITVGEGAASDYSFKILIIGDSSVGKSALLTRFSENTFLNCYTSTIGIDFNSRMIRVDRAICKLEIWDTAGQERFSTITANYYRGAQGALLVYDIGLKDSFEHVKNWYDRAKNLGGKDLECILIGNKNDLDATDRQVSIEEGELLAKELNIPFIETSALYGTNVEGAFVTMTSNIKKSIDSRGLTGVKASNLTKAGSVTLAAGDSKMKFTERCCGFN